MRSQDLVPLLKEHGWPLIDWYRALAIVLTRLPEAEITIEPVDGVDVLKIDSGLIQLLVWHNWSSQSFTVQGKTEGDPGRAYQVEADSDLDMVRAIVQLVKQLQVLGGQAGPSSSTVDFLQNGWYPGANPGQGKSLP